MSTKNTSQESPFLDALRSGVLLGDGATGSLLFELTGRLSETNHVYEALNIENTELVKQVHISYLQAGAATLKTNTFAANDLSLARMGVIDRTDLINRAGVQLARETIESFEAAEAGESPQRFVLGAVGPVQDDDPVDEVYRSQLEALIDEGVDALLFETFTRLEQAVQVVLLARTLPGCPPIVLHMSLNQARDDAAWSIDPVEYVTRAAEAGAAVIGVNCLPPWDAATFVQIARDLPEVRSGSVLLSAMPNAGGFERIGHRYMSRVNPEFMGRLARTLSEEGVRLIGGCCEVSSEHIREMAGFLRSKQVADVGVMGTGGQREPVGQDEKAGNGPFSRKLFAGEFVVSIEMLPPRGTGPRQLAQKAEFVSMLAENGLADAVDVTDGSRGIPLMPPGDFIQSVKEQAPTDVTGKIEFIPHFTSRDLNLMAVQSRLIGYFARSIHNVLFITGDPPKMSPTYPRSTAVFDLDSCRMVELTNKNLNAGVDFGGQPLGRQKQPQTHFTIGTGFEPEALDIAGEVKKLEHKLEAGADYVMTQPAFNWDALESVEPFRKKARIIVGVMVLTSLAHAERFAQVPGVRVPQEVFDRFAAFDDADDQRKCGLELAVSQAQRVRKEGWAGLYLMSPASPAAVPDVLKGLRG